MATLAGYGLKGFCGQTLSVCVVKAGARGMAEEAFFRNSAVEFQDILRRVARRKVPTKTVEPREGGLEQITSQSNQKGPALHSSTDLVLNGVLGGHSISRELMEHGSIPHANGNDAARTLVLHDSIGILQRNERTSHRGREITNRLSAMALDTSRRRAIVGWRALGEEEIAKKQQYADTANSPKELQ
jgi:hypothetical protein